MSIKKIKILAEKRKIPITKLCGKVGMSSANFYKCITRDSMESKYLIKFAAVLEVPVAYFFENNTHGNIDLGHKVNGNKNNISGDINYNDIEKIKTENKHLKELLKAKNEIIEILNK
ncbi:MAG: hypothetical protein KAT68_00575 [Bacteroidales bacterium]|nr:hypothetical protein [Bacteroidales bacterium]